MPSDGVTRSVMHQHVQPDIALSPLPASPLPIGADEPKKLAELKASGVPTGESSLRRNGDSSLEPGDWNFDSVRNSALRPLPRQSIA